MRHTSTKLEPLSSEDIHCMLPQSRQLTFWTYFQSPLLYVYERIYMY